MDIKDDDASSKRSRHANGRSASLLDEPAALGAIGGEGSVPDRPLLSARDSVMTRDSFITARSVFTLDGREIGDGLRGIDLDGAEPVAAR